MRPSSPPEPHPSSTGDPAASPTESISIEVDGKTVIVTDADLIQQIESSAPNIRAISSRMAGRAQAERNETAERRAQMTPIQRRRDVVRETIADNPLDKSDIHHIHSGLALCGLPYKRPQDGITNYQRKYGLMSISLDAGQLLDPNTGDWVRQGIPYGPKARLMLLHVCTQAIRQKSPQVELEESMSGFIRALGFSVTGGSRGTIGAFKEQLNRLAACRMQVGLWDGKNRAKTVNLAPIESFEVWFPDNPDQKMLWPSTVTLNHKFYESLSQHALPVNALALASLHQSARQMDMLMWLGYRLKSLKDSYFLTWDILKSQFCQSDQRRMIDFQRQFKEDLEAIQKLFRSYDSKGKVTDQLPVSLSDKGMSLKPCRPELLLVPPKRITR